MSKMSITYEFDTIEDSYEITSILRSKDYRMVLFDIDNILRASLKHDDKICENEYFCDYLETLRARINELDIYE